MSTDMNDPIYLSGGIFAKKLGSNLYIFDTYNLDVSTSKVTTSDDVTATLKDRFDAIPSSLEEYEEELNAKAEDDEVVHLTGNETVGGTKTFTEVISGDIDGNAETATALETARTITLEGDVSGSASFDGSANISINAVVADDSHNHVISNVDSLQDALDAKAEDDEVVHLTGNETVGGTKTFSSDSGATGAVLGSSSTLTFFRNFTLAPSTSVNQYATILVADADDTSYAIVNLVRFPSRTAVRLRSVGINSDTNETFEAEFDLRAYDTGVSQAQLSASLVPKATSIYSLGTQSNLWSELFAATGTINTSDERLKDNISSFPDEVLDAWGEVGWVQFQFKDSIAEKGEESARLHSGLIAQRIDEVFHAHGLDASRYGLFCHDSWDAQEEEKDEDGNVVQEAREAGDQYSLRYEEALCMEAAYQRRRADRMEARLSAIEERLNQLS